MAIMFETNLKTGENLSKISSQCKNSACMFLENLKFYISFLLQTVKSH
jgi:hypothetical protein